MRSAGKLESLGRLGRTLVDIGPVRLQRRLRYELRQRFDRLVPPWIALAWTRGNCRQPGWRPLDGPSSGEGALLPPLPTPELTVVSFNFLNQERKLTWPIHWNDPQWPRLWQFHLHYFDWARKWLIDALRTGHWPDQSAVLSRSWIPDCLESSRSRDGWHSYTLSLRTRNWIAFFRECPALATQAVAVIGGSCVGCRPTRALPWQQSLDQNPALAIGGLRFEGPKAMDHHRAMRLLQRELSIRYSMVAEERSASTLLMLNRLAELAQALQVTKGDRPLAVWAIAAMVRWVELIRLETGEAPRFNDSAADAAPLSDAVLASATLYCHSDPHCPSMVCLRQL